MTDVINKRSSQVAHPPLVWVTRAVLGWHAIESEEGNTSQNDCKEGGKETEQAHTYTIIVCPLVEDACQKPGTKVGSVEGILSRVLKVLNLRSHNIATAMRSLGNGNFSAALWSYETTVIC